MKDDLLQRIQNWYRTNCDGDWEHSWGLSITTLDNPGWAIRINLEDTSLESLQFERKIDNGVLDWIFIEAKEKIFQAHCDPTKLKKVLEIFLDELLPKYSDKNFYYQVYVPLDFSEAEVWRPVKARMITESELEIVEISDLNYEDIKTKSLDDISFTKEKILACKTKYFVGQKISTYLTEMFDKVTLTVEENNCHQH